MLETIWQDARHAARMLWKNPGFTAIAILSMAIGVGANASMFSVADALLLRPLPVPQPGNVIVVSARTPGGQIVNRGISYPDYRDLQDNATTLSGVVAFRPFVTSFAAHPDNVAQGKYGYAVSGNLFDVLRVRAEIGRTFVPNEDRVVGRDAVVVLAHETWQRDLGGDPAVINQRVRLGRQDFTIVGVLPASFDGLDNFVPPAYYVPIAMLPGFGLSGDLAQRDVLTRREARGFRVMARIAPGRSLTQVDEDVASIARRLERDHPDSNQRHGLVARTALAARQAEYGGGVALVTLLLILSSVVLLVACANLSGLLASRAPARAREMAVRLSIGGSRGRVVRQMLIESLLIAGGGTVAGMAVAYAGISVFRQFQLVSDVGIRLTYNLDERAVTVGLVAAATGAIAATLIPAWRASGIGDLASTLRRGGEGIDRQQRLWGRQGLVAVQVALSLVLVTLAVSFYYAFAEQLATGPGVRTSRMALLTVDTAIAAYDQPRAEAFFSTLRDRAEGLPGVTSATLTSFAPLSQDSAGIGTIAPEGIDLPGRAASVSVMQSTVDEHYFTTMQIRLLHGRNFRSGDSASSPRVVILNRHLAEHYWPGQDPVGRRLRLGDLDAPWAEIVGVVGDSKYRLLGEAPQDGVYVPLAQAPAARLTLLAATNGESAALTPQLRSIVASLDADIPVSHLWAMEDFYQRSTVYQGVVVRIVGGLGLMGLLLAIVGLYGLVANAVSRRTREIGVRMAVGATPGTVVRLMLGHGLLPTLAGTVLGALLSRAAAAGMRLAFPTTGHSIAWVSLAVIPVVFAAVLLAAYVPARRASHIDPLAALRTD